MKKVIGVIMQTIFNAVEKNRQIVFDTAKYIWENPETGYKEFKADKYLKEQMTKLGYEIVPAENITGFYSVLDTGKPGPTVLVLAELDSVICPDHKCADPKTGAVHACGHHAQCAALIGVAAALKEKGVTDGLSGKIKLCFVPAEELLEIEFRSELKKKGIIKYYGGKGEFLYRGYFDDVDLAFMVHTSQKFSVNKRANGCLAKSIIYKGLAAHAGGSPWCGKNALYAATCGINAVNAIRETFNDTDYIRFHPIITSGGAIVNAIPERVKIETYVRGITFDSIKNANKRVNQALCGAALSLDNNVEIIDIPGYSPLVNAPDMIDLAKETYHKVCPGKEFEIREVGTGSTDMADLSCVMPVVHPYAGGAIGKGHGNDYYINDEESSYITSAKWQLVMLKTLLENGGERAKEIKKNFKPVFSSKEEFLAYQDSLNDSGDRITYNQDGTATIRL